MVSVPIVRRGGGEGDDQCHGCLLIRYPIGTETKHFIYFYLGHCAILLFKTQ